MNPSGDYMSGTAGNGSEFTLWLSAPVMCWLVNGVSSDLEANCACQMTSAGGRDHQSGPADERGGDGGGG